MSSRAAGRDGARDRIEVDGTADGCLAGLLRTVRVQVYGPVSCELSAQYGPDATGSSDTMVGTTGARAA
ncbi:hypothetical protein F5X71_22490 [Nocardia brasiliensis]|uniref:Uncharacterized protein n=1 Tax=Nocardia brasiliensis TaxID=37326 RepID=A0A6G9XUZ4_NOCBR|nr:hypothetical protein [Nocardia brasiliensis]QIS04727.1 hypothetical protein F5X71_22490 [Nocardia brasiliensis]